MSNYELYDELSKEYSEDIENLKKLDLEKQLHRKVLVIDNTIDISNVMSYKKR